MIEFYGALSYECKVDCAKRVAKNDGIIWLIATIIIGVAAITVGIIKNVLIYSVILTVLFIVVTIVSFIPSKRLLNYKIPIQLIIENGIITRKVVGSKKQFATKRISQIKKVIDNGDWYFLIFRFGNMNDLWVCQKNLMIKGTSDEFEKLFEGKIVYKSNKSLSF